MEDELVFERWTEIHDVPKALFGFPLWKTVEEQSSKQKKGKTLNSFIALRQRLTVSVWAENGMNMEDVQVRIMAPADGGLYDVSCIFCVYGDFGWTTIARMDFFPNSKHINKDWKKLHIPSLIEGSHHHSYHLNRKIGLIRFKPKGGNVDNAINFLSPVNSFYDIFKLIETEWNIKGASKLSVPERQGGLI